MGRRPTNAISIYSFISDHDQRYNICIIWTRQMESCLLYTSSKVTLSFWIQPWLVYKLLFKKNLLDYFGLIIKYLSAFLGITAICYMGLQILNLRMNFIILVLEGILVLAVTNLILWILFGRTVEFRELIELVKNKIQRK